MPWCYDLPERFRERFGRDLLPLRRSLFAGNTAEDRGVRRQFWSLVADLVAERYFGAIQAWCAAHHIASSGHSLWEEEALHHVAIEGNGLKALGRMDIPGEDLLTSDPEAVLYTGWMTAAMPSSAAVLHGHRRVMTETSDFAQIQSGQGPAGLPEMRATAAWQAAWGVTDFSLYYSLAQRSIEKYRAYCDYVGRLNAILKPAQLSPRVLLYYPIYDLWSEYLPVAEPLRLESQSRRAQRLVQSFMHLGQTLQRAQIPFMLIDHENLSRAAVQAGGKLAITGHCFDAILLPEGVELPRAAADVVEKARQVGFRVLAGPWDESKVTSLSLVDALRPEYQIAPASAAIALGEFVRDGRSILLTVNVGRQPYEGHFAAASAGGWQRMDPADGTIRPAEVSLPGRVRLSLAPGKRCCGCRIRGRFAAHHTPALCTAQP